MGKLLKEKSKLKDHRYSFNVYLTSFTSFFTDVSSEMIYPLLQAFIKSVLSGVQLLVGPILGLIEGIAESTASLVKLFAGYFSDRLQKRKLPAIAGYLLSALSKLLLFLGKLSWIFVLSHRFFDRVGKGMRSAPRDALIADSVPEALRGKAFGIQRGFDFAGASIGVLISFFLARTFLDPISAELVRPESFFLIFAISIIPAFLAVVFLFFTREPLAKKVVNFRPVKISLSLKHYDTRLKLFFLAQFIFTLGNSSNQFLFLRALDLGSALSEVILMYLVFNLATTALATFFGSLSDRLGRKRIIILGYGLYSLVYASFGLLTPEYQFLLWLLWPLYGLYYAMTESVERALVVDLAAAEYRGTALGFYYTIVGIGLLPASLIAGLLYALWPCAPFLFGAATSLLSLLLLALFIKEKE